MFNDNNNGKKKKFSENDSTPPKSRFWFFFFLILIPSALLVFIALLDSALDWLAADNIIRLPKERDISAEWNHLDTKNPLDGNNVKYSFFYRTSRLVPPIHGSVMLYPLLVLFFIFKHYILVFYDFLIAVGVDVSGFLLFFCGICYITFIPALAYATSMKNIKVLVDYWFDTVCLIWYCLFAANFGYHIPMLWDLYDSAKSLDQNLGDTPFQRELAFTLSGFLTIALLFVVFLGFFGTTIPFFLKNEYDDLARSMEEKAEPLFFATFVFISVFLFFLLLVISGGS